jgi:hypothetical protein
MKVPIVKGKGYARKVKTEKRISNRKIRHSEVGNGSGFKKVYDVEWRVS